MGIFLDLLSIMRNKYFSAKFQERNELMIAKEFTLTCFLMSLSEAKRVTKKGIILIKIKTQGSSQVFVHT